MEQAGFLYGWATGGRVPGGNISVDVIGMGAGVYNRLVELGVDALPFVASAKTWFTDQSGQLGFANWRAAGWWLLREMMDPASGIGVCLPPNDELTGDLTAVRVARYDSQARVTVVDKETLRKEVGRSTDAGDAVMMALTGPALMADWTAHQEGGGMQQMVETQRITSYGR